MPKASHGEPGTVRKYRIDNNSIQSDRNALSMRGLKSSKPRISLSIVLVSTQLLVSRKKRLQITGPRWNSAFQKYQSKGFHCVGARDELCAIIGIFMDPDSQAKPYCCQESVEDWAFLIRRDALK